jgi:hypothetical protein
MPIYAYKCDSCGFAKDVLQKISDAALDRNARRADPPYLQEAGDRSRIPAQGLGLVCHRLQSGGSTHHANGLPGDGKPVPGGDGSADRARADAATVDTKPKPPRQEADATPVTGPAPAPVALPSHAIKKYLITGLLVWLPLAITVWVMLWLVGLLDGIFAGVLTGLEAFLPDGQSPMIERLRSSTAWV